MRPPERMWARNHRGSDVPVVLGFALVAGGLASTVVLALTGRGTAAGSVAAGAALLVATAGLVDDLGPGGPRGLRGHLRALAQGNVSTGVLKLVVIVAASLITVAASGRAGAITRIFGVILIAGATNVWNGLDVRPGRALKWFLLLAATSAVWAPRAAPFAVGVAVMAALVFWPDARERAMLGDAGANLLGFTAGMALFVRSPASWIPFEALAVVALNALAETVSLSRVIESSPALRWFDRLGTLPAEEETGV